MRPIKFFDFNQATMACPVSKSGMALGISIAFPRRKVFLFKMENG